MITQLEKEFIGTGEVKDFKFERIGFTEAAYCYQVTQPEGNIHYEVFERKNSPVCIDFEKRVYSETDFKETYPKSNSFGVWAWSRCDAESAIKLMKYIKLKEKKES